MKPLAKRRINPIKIERQKCMVSIDGKGFLAQFARNSPSILRDCAFCAGRWRRGSRVAVEGAKEKLASFSCGQRDFRQEPNTWPITRLFCGGAVIEPVPRLQAIHLDEAALRFQIAMSICRNATSRDCSRRCRADPHGFSRSSHGLRYSYAAPDSVSYQPQSSRGARANGYQVLHQARPPLRLVRSRSALVREKAACVP